MRQLRGYTISDCLDDAITVLNDIENDAEEMMEYNNLEDRERCYKRILEAVEEIRERMR